MIADELAYFGESQIFHSTKNIHPAKQDTKYGCNPTPPLSTPITFNFCQLSWFYPTLCFVYSPIGRLMMSYVEINFVIPEIFQVRKWNLQLLLFLLLFLMLMLWYLFLEPTFHLFPLGEASWVRLPCGSTGFLLIHLYMGRVWNIHLHRVSCKKNKDNKWQSSTPVCQIWSFIVRWYIFEYLLIS